MVRAATSAPATRQTEYGSASYDECFTAERLNRAWQKAKQNRGGAGGDGITIEAFACCAEASLLALRRRLLDGSYRPGPPRRTFLSRCGHAPRLLEIPSIADRIAQGAVLDSLSSVLDAKQSDSSFAYRPGRSVTQAVAFARRYITDGLEWIVDADIERYFQTICHRQLIAELAIWIEDERLLRLLALWVGHFGDHGKGVPQGAPLSPLLANLYLHPIDQILGASGIAFARYADDSLLLCRSRSAAERARRLLANLLAQRGLRLNEGKTQIVHAARGVRFLGELLVANSGQRDDGRRLTHRVDRQAVAARRWSSIPGQEQA